MLNSTLQSTKSGGPLAGAWAVVETIGDAGYERLAAEVLDAVDRGGRGRRRPAGGSRSVVPPDSTLVALVTDDSCDPFTVSDEMAERGWYVQPQLSHAGQPATIHLSLSAATAPQVPDLLAALADAVAAAVGVGPVVVDDEIAAVIAALDPGALTDADFDGLLAASGLLTDGGDDGLALPDRMAEVNAMLDLAAPALREALLIAFLDRLSRPLR